MSILELRVVLKCGPEFLLLFVSVSLNLYLIECYASPNIISVSPPTQQALSGWYLKLAVKLCFLEASPLICPLANVDIACEILKVPVFVGRVFFILIRNLDLQNGMSKEISQFYHSYY